MVLSRAAVPGGACSRDVPGGSHGSVRRRPPQREALREDSSRKVACSGRCWLVLARSPRPPGPAWPRLAAAAPLGPATCPHFPFCNPVFGLTSHSPTSGIRHGDNLRQVFKLGNSDKNDEHRDLRFLQDVWPVRPVALTGSHLGPFRPLLLLRAAHGREAVACGRRRLRLRVRLG